MLRSWFDSQTLRDVAERVYKDARKTVHNPFLVCTHMHNHLVRSPAGLYPLLESSDPFGDIVRHMIAGKTLKLMVKTIHVNVLGYN